MMNVNYRTVFILVIVFITFVFTGVLAAGFLGENGAFPIDWKFLTYTVITVFSISMVALITAIHRLFIKPINAITRAIEQKAKDEHSPFDLPGTAGELISLNNALFNVFDAESKAKAQIKHLAFYDNLTGLANRRLFKSYLGSSIASCARNQKKLALLFIDLDNFKVINDHYGHQIGDRVLAEFANRIKRITRGTDLVSVINPDESSNIARLAGDEFAILLSGLTDTMATVSVAERILESTHQPVEIENHKLYVQASIGIATYPDDALNADELIRHADAAMYHAKTSGKHTYHFFSKTLSKILQRQRQVQEALRTALLNDEFHLEFHPYVDSKDFKLAGVELLLRWQSHTLGNVSPGEFVPIAESCGLMKEIDAWVISEGCEMLSDWRKRGLPPVRCSINLSAGELRNRSLPAFIDACLKSHDLSPSDLELEITETKLVDHDDRTIQVLEGLNSMGLSLALDDFGRGFTSLNQLVAFPVHKLKIDKTFIAELNDKERLFKIADVILMLSRSYNLTATAEGVENIHQARYLSQSGCQYLQGYYFSKPVSRQSFEAMLANENRTLPLPSASITSIDSGTTRRTY